MQPRLRNVLLILVGLAILIALFLIGSRVVTAPTDGLVGEAEFIVSPSGSRALVGTVVNESDENTFTSITATIEFLDRQGAVVGTDTATKDILGPGQSWSFEYSDVPAEAVDVRIEAHSPDIS